MNHTAHSHSTTWFGRVFILSMLFFTSLLVTPLPAHAYVGPGAGFAFLGSTFVFLATILMAIATVLFWPLQWIWRKARGKGIPRKARARRVIVIGLDGLEPSLVEKYIDEGKLPNLKALRERGSYNRLGTTLPALSPVAWSTFQTGVNPGAHNIFDFLTRDKRLCMPLLSSVDTEEGESWKLFGRWTIKKAAPKIKLLRKSQPFWKILGNHGVFCNILRVPISYPPEKTFGNVLSAMCTPDLRGTQGTFSLFTTDAQAAHSLDGSHDATGGEVHSFSQQQGYVEGELIGPADPRNPSESLTVKFRLTPSQDNDTAVLEIGKHTEVLTLNNFSPWITVEFQFGFRKKISGVCRFCLREISPQITLYASPVNVDPKQPALPIASPIYYAGYLARKHGTFGTLGLMEDTWGRNEHALDDALFVQQTYLTHHEREEMLLDALDRTPDGLCVCVFDASDRLQHMFWRYLDPKHPSPLEGNGEFSRVIPEMYEKMDALVGRVLQKTRPQDAVLVISDHGFTSFRRGVNINTWLMNEGYLVLKDGATKGDYLSNVDWSRTRAFGLGLAGIYINRAGREQFGIVQEGDVDKLKVELAQKIEKLTDPQDGECAVRKVHDTSIAYRGVYADEAPDLIVGYAPGFRVSWESVKGVLEEEVFTDNVKAWSGDHHVDPECVPGIFFSNREMVVEKPNIVDIAPTILDLFSVPVPSYMEGKVLL